jgi:hypothetical protein
MPRDTSEPVDQGFILCAIVGGLVMNLQDILELLSLRRDK